MTMTIPIVGECYMEEKKPVIKIFVSLRIDLEYKLISDNPLYVNVRCGAVYDKRDPKKYMGIEGDNTGDNISNKRNEFCELTVQYWAWKNQKADYYGLCHYRRYMSFSEKRYPTILGEHDNGCVEVKTLSDKTITEHNLTEEYMTNEILKYDLICMEPLSLKKFGVQSNYEAMKSAPAWHKMEDVDRTIDIIKRLHPEMYKAALDYFYHSDHEWLYNCWIMNKELFNMFCQFQFDVLFELDKYIDYSNYSRQQRRTCGAIAERLFGVFVTYIESLKKYKINYQQLLIVRHTEPQRWIQPAYSKNNIPVVVLSSDYYVPYLYVYLYSLLKSSNSTSNYDIIVLEKSISQKHKEDIMNLFMESDNISIRFYKPIYEIADSNLFVADARYSEEAYYRMLTPWILEDYDKAIVMDCDIILKDDIAELYNIDVSGYLAAGVKDVIFQGFLNGMVPDTMEYALKEMKMKNPYHYINTGVLVMNLKEWRAQYKERDIIHLMQTKKFRIQEQDILNTLFENKVKFMSIEWNYYIAVSEFIKMCADAAPLDSMKAYYDAAEHPHLYHYASSPKPWDDPDMLHGDIWWNYARQTPFYEEILYRRINGMANYVINMCEVKKDYSRTKLLNVVNKIAPCGSKRRENLKRIYKRIKKFKKSM